MRSGLYKVTRRPTIQAGTHPGRQPLPTSSVSRGELGTSIVLTNLYIFNSPWDSFISRDGCCTFAQLYLQPHGPVCQTSLFKAIYRSNAIYQATNGILHRARTNNFTICMEIQKTSNSQSNLEKEEWNWRKQSA